MTKRIDETLKKIAENISKANTPITSNTKSQSAKISPVHDLPGDPDCPICRGVGYIRQDLPIGHPEFGKIQPCVCRQREISLQAHERLFALSNLNELSHLTFETFQPRGRMGLHARQSESLESAFNISKQFSQTLNGWLVLQGGFGCGKTHLAAAIANFAVSVGVPTLFLTVPDLLDTLRFSFDDPEATFEQRFDEIRNAALLVLDDFGTQNATAWAQEKLFQIINYRYINHMPTVITTNLPLDMIEGRIRSRLQDSELVTRVVILATDYRRPAGDLGHHELSSLDLMHEMTFDHFSLRRDEDLSSEDLQNLNKAYQVAWEYAQAPYGWLVFIGVHGCGKTHLAAAIGNYRLEQGDQPIFASVPEMLDELRATFSPDSSTSMDWKFEQYKTCSLLILDALGTQSSTPWAREKLNQLFDFRYISRLPTIITTVEALDKLDSLLRSRMLDTRICKVFAITGTDYRGGGISKPKPTRRGRTPTPIK